MNNLVLIIIPTKNRVDILVDTINSFKNQTYMNWELIIVDDGSEDETKYVVLRYVNLYCRFKYFTRPENLKKGPSSCRNYGVGKSIGKFINWFDDDVMMPEFLELKVSLFQQDVDAVICKLQHYNFQDNISINETKIYSENLIEDYLIGKVIFLCQIQCGKENSC